MNNVIHVAAIFRPACKHIIIFFGRLLSRCLRNCPQDYLTSYANNESLVWYMYTVSLVMWWWPLWEIVLFSLSQSKGTFHPGLLIRNELLWTMSQQWTTLANQDEQCWTSSFPGCSKMLKTTGRQRESPGMLSNTVGSRDDTHNVRVSTVISRARWQQPHGSPLC